MACGKNAQNRVSSASKVPESTETHKNTCVSHFANFADLLGPSENTQKHVKSDTFAINTQKHTKTHVFSFPAAPGRPRSQSDPQNVERGMLGSPKDPKRFQGGQRDPKVSPKENLRVTLDAHSGPVATAGFLGTWKTRKRTTRENCNTRTRKRQFCQRLP